MGALISCSCPNADSRPDLNTRTVITDFRASISLGPGVSAAHNPAGKRMAASHTQWQKFGVIIFAPNVWRPAATSKSRDLVESFPTEMRVLVQGATKFVAGICRRRLRADLMAGRGLN